MLSSPCRNFSHSLVPARMVVTPFVSVMGIESIEIPYKNQQPRPPVEATMAQIVHE